MAQQKLFSHHNSVSSHQPFVTASAPSDSLLSLCLGLEMEERTRQMKLKMNKYKQGAGSDSRLEQDYYKVKACGYSECMLRYPTRAANMYLQHTVCIVALGIGHMAHLASSQACTHAHINITLHMCIDTAQSVHTGSEQTVSSIPKQVNTQFCSTVRKH